MSTEVGIYLISERGITRFSPFEKSFLNALNNKLYTHQRVSYTLPKGVFKGSANSSLILPQLADETVYVNAIIVSPQEAGFCKHLFNNEPIS